MRSIHFLLISILTISFSEVTASCRLSSEFADSIFTTLATDYTGVGKIVALERAPDEYELAPHEMFSHGSAVLIDTAEFAPHLNGRVALTAAHVAFNNEIGLPYEELYFGINDEERIHFSTFIHPDYDHSQTLNDIAIIILDDISSGLPCPVNLDVTKAEIQRELVIHCGFGDVRSLDKMARITDVVSRAAHSKVFSPYTDGIHGTDTRTLYTVTKDVTGNILSEDTLEVVTNKGSVFHSSPFDQGKVGMIVVDSQSAGTVSGGDSGGGCFLENGFLIGINSKSNQDRLLKKPDVFFLDARIHRRL